MPNDLKIAKLHAYGFDSPSLKLIRSCLTESYQINQSKNMYSSYKLIKHEYFQWTQGIFKTCLNRLQIVISTQEIY